MAVRDKITRLEGIDSGADPIAYLHIAGQRRQLVGLTGRELYIAPCAGKLARQRHTAMSEVAPKMSTVVMRQC